MGRQLLAAAVIIFLSGALDAQQLSPVDAFITAQVGAPRLPPMRANPSPRDQPTDAEVDDLNQKWLSDFNKADARVLETLSSRLPRDRQRRAQGIYKKLAALGVEELYLLKAADACDFPQMLDCMGLSNSEVKPF